MSDNKFSMAMTMLLEGKFVCETTAPELFRWLSEESAQTEIDGFLNKLGRRLAVTPARLAFYSTWIRLGTGERAEVKKTFAAIKQTIHPMVRFLTLCMQVERKDSSPSVGDRVDYAPMLKAVTENSHLSETLREFGTISRDFAVADASSKSMLEKVFQQMERWGYLVSVNSEHATYRFTGKLDYFYQVLEFLKQYNGDAKLAETEQDEVAERRLV